jgi:hypothetical protein
MIVERCVKGLGSDVQVELAWNAAGETGPGATVDQLAVATLLPPGDRLPATPSNIKRA